MSFLKILQKAAGEIAQAGLDRIGIKYEPSPDDGDPDTQTRDIFDIVFDVASAGNAVPVAQSARPACMALAERYAGSNGDVRKAIEAWFADRRELDDILSAKRGESAAAAQNRTHAPLKSDAETIRRECLRIMAFFGVLKEPETPPLRAAFAVCEAQRRNAKNLLYQADRRVRDEYACANAGAENGAIGDMTLSDWIEAMNGRLEPFGIALEIVDNWLTIADCDCDAD